MICNIKRFVKYLLDTYYVKLQLYVISSVEQSN